MVDFLDLTQELCALPTTGIVADGNAAFFERLRWELPFEIRRWQSGDCHNGWVVPDLWRVQEAELRRDSRLVYDGARHPLGVAHYSRSYSGRLTLADLRRHLFSAPSLPDALVWHCNWLYRPWEKNWGFSLPHRLLTTLPDGMYDVNLRVSFEPGEMLLGEFEHKGESEETIVFHSNNCHPHFANDGFAGTAVMIRLFQWLRNRETYYSYRLVVGPEHLGTVFYLRDLGQAGRRRLVGGVFGEMMGTEGPFKVASTFHGDHILDRVFRHVVGRTTKKPEFVPFAQSTVNDETVWEAAGWEIPFVAVSRTRQRYRPFPEYHTNFDNADLMQGDLLEEFYEVFKSVIEIFENNFVLRRKFEGLVALSNPKYSLYIHHVDPAVQDDSRASQAVWAHLQDRVMRYFDGQHTILDVAEMHDLPFPKVLDYLRRFEEKDLVSFERRQLK